MKEKIDRAYENCKRWYGEIAAFTGGSSGVESGMPWIRNPYDNWYGGVFDINPYLEDVAFESLVQTARRGIEIGLLPDKLLISEGVQSLTDQKRQMLKKNGFYEDMAQTGMVLCLEGWKGSVSLPVGDAIIRAETGAECSAWTAAAEEAFGAAEHHAILDCFTRDPRLILYTYLRNGEIAATSMVHESKEEAGVYLVGTVERFRRMGMAGCLVRTLLLEAQRDGMKYGVLQASDMGRPVYENIGFEAVSRISHWAFQKQQPELFLTE